MIILPEIPHEIPFIRALIDAAFVGVKHSRLNEGAIAVLVYCELTTQPVGTKTLNSAYKLGKCTNRKIGKSVGVYE